VRNALIATLAAALFIPGQAVASCGAAFCLVNTNWSVQGVWNKPGLRADLRYEYIDQDQPRTGTRDIAVGEIQHHHDEVRTINRNLFATFDYGFTQSLGASLVVPWVDRKHEHIHNHRGAALPESWNFSEFGDIRLTGRYQILAGEKPESATLSFAGVTAGVKLPTGKTDIENGEGAVAERTLQPGTGTTDALLGAYYRQAIGQRSLSWFVQANALLPLNSHDNFRPGKQFLADLGARWEATNKLALLLQLNAHWKGRDSGSEAEPEDSGSRMVSVSPGLTFAFTPQVQVYAFVQLPVYQYVNGVQLVANRSYAVGASLQF
jgi:hypothetical protein